MSPCRSHPLAVAILSRISGSLSFAMRVPLRDGRSRCWGRPDGKVRGRRATTFGVLGSIISSPGAADKGQAPTLGAAERDADDPRAVLAGDRRRQPPGRDAAAGDGPDAHPAPGLPELLGRGD